MIAHAWLKREKGRCSKTHYEGAFNELFVQGMFASMSNLLTSCYFLFFKVFWLSNVIGQSLDYVLDLCKLVPEYIMVREKSPNVFQNVLSY